MITKFQIFEGRGISDIIKSYSTYLYDNYVEGNSEYELDLDDYQELPLTSLKISIKKGNILKGLHTPGEIIKKDNNYFITNSIISFIYNDIKSLKGLIAHELTHIKEYYEIMKQIDTLGIKITPIYIKIRNVYNDIKDMNTDYYNNFLYLIYLSLSTEMNSRVAQVYDFLYDFDIKDENELFNKLKQHKNFDFLELLKIFNSIDFVNNMINLVGIETFINITQIFIDKLNSEFNKPIEETTDDKKKKFLIKQNIKEKYYFNFLDKKVDNKDDLIYIYNNFQKYFQIKSKNHTEHFKYIIKEVIEDLNESNTFHTYCRLERKDNLSD